MTTLTMEGILMEALQDTVELLEGSHGGRFHQDVSVDDGKCLPKVPKKALPTLNEAQRALDFYQTFKSQVLRWRVSERSKLFEKYFSNAIQDHAKARELYSEIVSRHPSWSLVRVLPLIKRINHVDEEEIAREF